MSELKPFILLMGASGSGKSTAAELLEKVYEHPYIKSYTTRPKRDANEKGHIFISEEDFVKFDKNTFVAYTEYDGHHYFATENQVQNNDVYIIDPAGVKYFNEHYKGEKLPVVVYLDAPPEIREKHMRLRGDNFKAIYDRLRHDDIAFRDAENLADVILTINDTPQTQPDSIAKELNKILASRIPAPDTDKEAQ